MTVTLQGLLHQPQFRLRLANPASSLDEGALLRPISWVHSSDLDDPTPFLEAGQLLLTDGTQFPFDDAEPERADAYAARLAAHGILGLGFATQFVHGRLPEPLRAACLAHRLPLLEVPERIPFIAIIQHVAAVNAKDEHARSDWLLGAQRAIARAARRPDALPAILGELERSLDAWVALFDASGDPVAISGLRSAPERSAELLRIEVAAALERPQHGAWRIETDELSVMFQTIGPSARPRGVLAIGGASDLDAAGRELIGSVIAFAGVTLDHSRAVEASRHELRSAVLQLLLAGAYEAAAAVSRPVWGGIRSGPTGVVVAALPRRGAAVLEALEARVSGARRMFFAVEGDDIVVLCAEEAMPAATTMLVEAGLTVGASLPMPLGELRTALAQARRARDAALRGGLREQSVAALDAHGFLPLLPREEAVLLARGIVDRLRTADARDGTTLLHAVTTWLRHDCAWTDAAAELGIHRHSLRNRVDAAGRLLELDLDTVRDRSALWIALEVLNRG